MLRKDKFAIDEYYHVYNRGIEKRILFLDKYDYNRFITILHLCNSKNGVDISKTIREGLSFPELVNIEIKERLVYIGAYCLMPNHFHLLLKEKNENGISLFMRKLLTAYSMYFNRKYKRTGVLFEGPFKSIQANTDEYLKYLLSYIHLNPIKMFDPEWKKNGIRDMDRAKKYLLEYKYSSYLDYIGIIRKENKIIDKTKFPEYFIDFKDFQNFIEGWLNFNFKFKSETIWEGESSPKKVRTLVS